MATIWRRLDRAAEHTGVAKKLIRDAIRAGKVRTSPSGFKGMPAVCMADVEALKPEAPTLPRRPQRKRTARRVAD